MKLRRNSGVGSQRRRVRAAESVGDRVRFWGSNSMAVATGCEAIRALFSQLV